MRTTRGPDLGRRSRSEPLRDARGEGAEAGRSRRRHPSRPHLRYQVRRRRTGCRRRTSAHRPAAIVLVCLGVLGGIYAAVHGRLVRLVAAAVVRAIRMRSSSPPSMCSRCSRSWRAPLWFVATIYLHPRTQARAAPALAGRRRAGAGALVLHVWAMTMTTDAETDPRKPRYGWPSIAVAVVVRTPLRLRPVERHRQPDQPVRERSAISRRGGSSSWMSPCRWWHSRAAFLLGRRTFVGARALFFLIGLAVVACSTVASIAYVQTH